MGTWGPIVYYINRIHILIESWVQCGFRQSIVFHSTGADGEARARVLGVLRLSMYVTYCSLQDASGHRWGGLVISDCMYV